MFLFVGITGKREHVGIHRNKHVIFFDMENAVRRTKGGGRKRIANGVAGIQTTSITEFNKETL